MTLYRFKSILATFPHVTDIVVNTDKISPRVCIRITDGYKEQWLDDIQSPTKEIEDLKKYQLPISDFSK
jgi:hypothetical protein